MAEQTKAPVPGKAAGAVAEQHKGSTPDLLRDLHGRVCPACGEGRARVVERGELLLLTCSNGCPGRAIEAAALREFPNLCGVGHTIVDQMRPEPLASDANATRTTSDGRQYPARRAPVEPALLPGLDPFQRFEARLNVAPELRPALELLLAADAGELPVPTRASVRAAIEVLTCEPGAAPVAARTPLEQTCDAIAGTLLEGVLAAAPGRRAEAARLLREVARFAARGPAAAPTLRAAA